MDQPAWLSSAELPHLILHDNDTVVKPIRMTVLIMTTMMMLLKAMMQ